MDRICLALAPDDNDRLDAIAAALRIPKSRLIRAAIKGAIPKWEGKAREAAIDLAAELDELSRR